MSKKTQGKSVVIVGAGLAGALLACGLSRAGWRVRLFERRSDPRKAGYVGGRSINLALSARGLAGLRGLEDPGLGRSALGLDRIVLEREALPMAGRMLHARDGAIGFQPYSKDPRDAIYSVSRGGLNMLLLNEAERLPNVEIFFEHLCVDADLGAERDAPAAIFAPGRSTPLGPAETPAQVLRMEADLIVGTDGAFSAGRARLQRLDRFEYSQSYLKHGYKELEIPASDRETPWMAAESAAESAGGGRRPYYAMDPGALHIWPRGSAMMIALPNRDGSFTCTLFWPYEGEHSFASVREGAGGEADKADSGREMGGSKITRVRDFFAEHYGDAAALMPTLERDYARNPTSSLVTVRCWPWQAGGKLVLLGDAAHAIVPFYGQGMNCAFEDCLELERCLHEYSGDQRAALEAFQARRKPNADAIADMALENFVEMRDKVGDAAFLYKKRVEQTVHGMFPDRVAPQYNLVSFSTVPYVEARRRGRELDAVLERVIARAPMAEAPRAGATEARGGAEAEEHRRAVEAWQAKIRAIAVEELDAAGSSAPGPDAGELGRAGGSTDSRTARFGRVSRTDALIDISPRLSPGIGVWRDDTPMTREVLCDIAKGANITLSTLRTTVHLGSHADGPNHYGLKNADGSLAPGIDQMPLEHYIGPCVVIEARATRGTRYSIDDLAGPQLEKIDAARDVRRVLIRTGTFPDHFRWNDDFAAMEPSLVDELARRGVITVGVDTPSVDLFSSKDLPAHQAFLRNNVAIIEGVVLDEVEPGVYELFAQPLRLEGFDASPVRAVLRRAP
ncbi:MAG: FAD-dependent monooxygenase [Planctomycetota bacterium]|nr:FAD-dependent monooxygenase [Planctomycetota bacterium]